MKLRLFLGAIVLISMSAPALAATTTSSPEQAQVLSVIDGDTLRVRIGKKAEKVRIIGIDTPETKDPRKPVQCFGKEATAKLRKLVQRKKITLEKNPAEERDKYRRLLRYVHLKDEDIGATMIREGYAFSYKQFPHPRLDAYNDLENQARDASKGLWAGCTASSGQNASQAASHDSTTKPDSGRSSSAATSSVNKQQCTIKGNISAKGEKIYHLPNCSSYNSTQIDTSTGEKWFCSESEAVALSWRKATNCP